MSDSRPEKNGLEATSNEDKNESPIMPILHSWVPITTRLLKGEKADSSSWYVMDHVMEEPDFVSHLKRELADQGILKNLSASKTNGEINQSTPAITDDDDSNDNDNDNNNIMALLLQMNGISPAITTTDTPAVRGDKSTFVSRTQRQQSNFSSKSPYLHSLISRVERTAQHHLGQHEIDNGSNCSMEFDLNLTSVQIAEFPGDATGQYPRHCDRKGNLCREESSTNSQSNGSKSIARILTFVYYLTPDDWDFKRDGGYLRVFTSCSGDDSKEIDHYVDVAPYQNRMIAFRSDGVEHEVRPSLRRPRLALTIWLYGKIKGSSSGTEDIEVPCNKGAVDTKKQNEPQSTCSGPPPLPITSTLSSFPTTTDKQNQPTIFVSIAAYRDSETGPTLRHLQAMATHPERVFVGLVLQLDETMDYSIIKDLPSGSPWYQNNVRRLKLEARHALGPCYARALCQSLARGEDYILQIDSHMRFRKHWDTYLIEQLEQLVKTSDNDKVMLTAYPVGYQLPDTIPNETRGTLLVPWKFDRQGLLRQRGRLIQPQRQQQQQSIPCRLYAAGFNFSRSRVVQDCPYDPELPHLFFGEELSMAVRLYTKGYDLYAPYESVCYHLWSRAHRPTQSAAATKSSTLNDRSDLWHTQCKQESLNKTLQQLVGTAEAGRFGLGSIRTSQQFAMDLGVDFDKCTILVQAKPENVEFVGDATDYTPERIEEKVQTLATEAQDLIAAFLR